MSEFATAPESREVRDLLLQARGLALVRPILAARGVPQEELDAHTAELARVSERIAELTSGGPEHQIAA
jgi:hypothetical protein